jgi:tetratricopeptide (TPR) repeat protein/glycosyltransferase involved in cell wall biosynthesis/2-polyprenyl-3-methyl-5-hydroxy-6-metoxy-1,4-benzoquinol methylase
MIALSDDAEHKDLTLALDSARAVGFTDLVIAVDDRSHPNTVEWIGARWPGADAFLFEMEADGDPHFANARNLTLPRIPAECEFWGWMDSDDVIESINGQTIPAFLESLQPVVGAVAFNYHYADDEFGNPKGHIKVRLYRTRQPWRWRDRVHEDCEPADGKRLGLDIVVVKDEEEHEFRWVHHTENKVVQPGRNFRCLRRMIADDPDYPRVWFYLGNQHFAAHNWQLAAEAYERYVPLSQWDEERWWALVYSAIAYRELGDIDKAIERDLEAVSLIPNLVDAYFGLGESHTRKGDWARAITWGELGFDRLAAQDRGSRQLAIPSNRVWFNANAYSFQPYTWLAIAYNNVGEYEKALSCYEQAYKARPEEDIAKNIALLKAAMNRKRIIHNGIDLAAGLSKNGEPLKALDVLAALPAGSADDPNVVRMARHIAGQIAHLSDRTAYQNFYFSQEEKNDPLEPGVTSDESLERWVPRMMWALRRLKAAGAKKVLDIGVGDGTFDFLLARHGIQVVGIDVDWRRAQNANKNAVRAGYQSETVIENEPLVEFSADCACEHDESEHAYSGCKAQDCVCEAKWVETQAAQKVTIPQATPESMAQFLYSPPDQISAQVRALGPYDAVVGMELIEHVGDVDKTLDLLEEMAPRVLISTPDGGWNGPVSWNPGHVRAYSQRDLTRLLIQRGWLVEMHKCTRSDSEQGQLVAEYVKQPPSADARVVIFCPPTGQDWTPDSIRSGIGGSETAVIRVAEEFAALGKRVTVYAECEGLWNGVRYRFAGDFRPEPCEAFISWRTVGAAPLMREFAARRFIWAHDIHFGDATAEQLDGITVVALSEWHKQFMAERYPGARIEVLGNGIDPERFTAAVEKQPHRMIYAHSPDRGLDVVLELFPRVRERFPDAELHVFYGFDMARKKRPAFMAAVERMARHPGVTLHGWVGQERLAEEYLRAAVDYYPALTPADHQFDETGQQFPETYCISVVEAQAAGCVPITPAWGALGEINRHGSLIGADDDPVELIERAFEMDTTEMREWALAQTWKSVAERWVVLMRSESEVRSAMAE